MVKKVGPYSLESKLGEGSYGTVYFGHDSQSSQPIAAKAISLENLKSRFLEQLESEIAAMKKLDSPYIVKLYDVMKTSRNVYMVMEYCPGGDLDHYIKKQGATPEHLARKWLSQALQAFHCLRTLKILHRDLKLANILLSHEDPERADIKLADFGFAKILNEVSKAKTMLGTPLFMAPEIFNKESYTFSVDIWSLGVLAYELLVGRGPFQCKSIEELKQAQRDGVTFPADCTLSEQGRDLVRGMLAYRPEDRPNLEQLQAHSFFTGSPLLHLPSCHLQREPCGSQSPELFSSDITPETPTFAHNTEEITILEQLLAAEKPMEHLVETFLTTSPVIAEYLTLKLTTNLDDVSRRVERGLGSAPTKGLFELEERVRMKKGHLKRWTQQLEESKAKASPDLSATAELLSEPQVELEAERLWRAVKSTSDPFEKQTVAAALVQLLRIIGSEPEWSKEVKDAAANI